MMILVTEMSGKKIAKAYGAKALGHPMTKRRMTVYFYKAENIDGIPRGMVNCASFIANELGKVVKNRYF